LPLHITARAAEFPCVSCGAYFYASWRFLMFTPIRDIWIDDIPNVTLAQVQD